MPVTEVALALGLLRKDVRSQLDEIGEADILVGIPSYNNAASTPAWQPRI